MFRSSSPPGVPPTPEEALACGSRSTRSVFFSITEREAARLTAVVVFPTPPFWLATVRIRANTGPPFPGNTTLSCITGGRGAKGEIPYASASVHKYENVSGGQHGRRTQWEGPAESPQEGGEV